MDVIKYVAMEKFIKVTNKYIVFQLLFVAFTCLA